MMLDQTHKNHHDADEAEENPFGDDFIPAPVGNIGDFMFLKN
jgi:hypothetical protein